MKANDAEVQAVMAAAQGRQEAVAATTGPLEQYYDAEMEPLVRELWTKAHEHGLALHVSVVADAGTIISSQTIPSERLERESGLKTWAAIFMTVSRLLERGASSVTRDALPVGDAGGEGQG